MKKKNLFLRSFGKQAKNRANFDKNYQDSFFNFKMEK